ncbi:hypothetical protein NEOLI_004688 [Neolecta irregularis DAH-3]|uniref:Uncharacterized protein n=1 Tax=Neolecta irregularis (strain DAH-3) TaxID=1198029 RepID=A0A1U7LJH3_NEOID|nr:hypothetical protein NEOLI_004688 [Neolecta irregularis DAH-3]|eukprot:OLL22797.1 hypothetical protein NEOLI_004688 [Neolecta irregularis DAH-3]
MSTCDGEQTGLDADNADSYSARRRRRSTSTCHELQLPESKRVRSGSPEPELAELPTLAFEDMSPGRESEALLTTNRSPFSSRLNTECEKELDGDRIIEERTTAI